jgi:hypothetical protein
MSLTETKIKLIKLLIKEATGIYNDFLKTNEEQKEKIKQIMDEISQESDDDQIQKIKEKINNL